MAAASNRHKLNNQDLFDVFGIAVEEGLGEFDTPFPIKEVLSHNWPEESGRDIDLSEGLNFDTKQIKLKCFFVASDRTEYYTKKAAFEVEMCKPGWQTWYNVDHDKSYSVKYEGGSSGKKASRRYQDVEVIVFTFDLTLTVQPTLQPNADHRVRVELNGVFYAWGAPGSTVNVITTNGGVTPTVAITNVVADSTARTITIAAVGSAGYDRQYSINSGANYQSSNVFENVADGTYTGKIMVRLVGTNITATWNSSVVILYVPPVLPETVSVDNVTVYTDFITVLASKANTTKSIEYSRNGFTFQSSNVFTGLANGTYTITARLIGTTITDVYDIPVTVNYTPAPTTFNTILQSGQSAQGVTFVGINGLMEFHFNSPISGEKLPATMYLKHHDYPTEIASINFPSGAIGQPCALKYNGQMYSISGGFRDGELNIG